MKEKECFSSRYNIYYRYHKGTKQISIVCIHGILSDSKLFDSFGSTLASKGFNIYAIDLPGYGASDVKFNDTDFDDVLASIHDFITNIDSKSFLLGFSLGSIYAGYYANRYADISGLILASPMFHPIDNLLPKYALCIYQSYQDNPEGRVNLLESLEFDDEKRNYIADNTSIKEYPLAYLFDICSKAINKEVLKNIKIPVLILYGKYDKFTHIKQVEETYRLLASNEKVLKILDTDHWLYDTFFYNGNKDSQIIDIIERWLYEVI